MENVKISILNHIPNDDYQVINCTGFRSIIEDVTIDVFNKCFNELVNEGKLECEFASDGMLIYKSK